MKNARKTVVFALLVCVLAAVGCKKEKLTPTEMLTAGTCWQVILLEGYEPGAELWVSVPVEDCLADNCFSFQADQSFKVDEGAAKCDANDPQSSVGAWSISEDGKKLALTDDTEVTIGDVVELTKEKLVYETTLDEAKVRVTMSAK
ncbi:MAG: lipocalin family protein [Saprospiraceae bacterium]|nr:lipocalin family protein [Saprospiraceae bacterium]